MHALGIDGGGTSSEVVIGSIDGRRLSQVATTGSNVRTLGPGRAISVLERALDQALVEAHVATTDIGKVCVGLAGISRAAERDPIERWLEERFSAGIVRLMTDVELVLAAGTPAETGLAIVSGTGSIAFGRDHTGQTRRAGGRGPSLGDPGSGFAIGRAALQRVADAFDGITAQGPLTAAISRHWPELSADFDLAGQNPAEIAGLGKIVADVAQGGDHDAISLLDQAGTDLARQATAVLRGLEWPKGPIAAALAGGVLAHIPQVRTKLLSELERMGFEISAELVEKPVLGAVRLAAKLPSPVLAQP